jgi:alkanesulfonate monooxygenase SsuD/methylene tetrahydromethanopterin reductase-like flavin-dependent oxidoreductase (luciferase family)
VLSGNRVSLGAGAGWMREEFEQLGQDFPTRGRRMDEMIAVLRKLWGGGMVEHHGRYCDFERLELSPVPSQPIPIYIGGESETALRRAARLGDGWISVQHTSEECKTLVERINRLRREYGRADQPFDIVMACTDAVDLAGYRRLTDFGVTSLLTAPWYLYGGDPTSLQTKHDALLRFGAEIVAQLS